MATISIPRALERYPLGKKLEGDRERWEATDRERGRDVIVTRVRFTTGERKERDELLATVRALYTVSSPALIGALDAGAWEDDAFVVEERVIEPRPLVEAAPELDAREKALAARTLAEGLAVLHEAGWTLDAMDVAIDAYRQPKIPIATLARRTNEVRQTADLAGLLVLVEQLAPGSPPATSARAMAGAVRVPEPTPAPLVHADAPRSSIVWVVALVILAIVALVLASR